MGCRGCGGRDQGGDGKRPVAHMTVQQYYADSNERITQMRHTISVSGFLGVNCEEIAISGITIFIGPQASGKSIVARLIFFFREYISDIQSSGVQSFEHKTTFDARMRNSFIEIFPAYAWTSDRFEICYTIGEFEIRIESNKGKGGINLKTSKPIADTFRALKHNYQKHIENARRETGGTARRRRVGYHHFISEPGYKDVAAPIDTLFVPAARAFYSYIRDEIFSILSIDGKLDPIIMQFGEFYDFSKKYGYIRNSDQWPHQKEFRAICSEILRGKHVFEDETDWIIMGDRRVEVRKASSGQQEALPLLLSLTDYPDRVLDQGLLIIEEPEAHLFPTAQKSIVDYIVQRHLATGCGMIFTTHSPYALACMNNQILRSANQNEDLDVAVYYFDEDRVRSIVDSSTGLVNAEEIDRASSEIALEFETLLSEAEGD